MPHEHHPGPLRRHPAEDLLIAGTPADERSIRAEGDGDLGFEAPETLRLDGLHLQAELLGHRPAVGPLVTVREPIEDETIGTDTGAGGATCDCGHRSRVEAAAHRDPCEAPRLPETIGDSPLEELPEVSGVVLVPRVAHLSRLWRPVAFHAQTAGVGDQPLAGGQFMDGREEAALRIFTTTGQIGRDLHLVVAGGDRRMPEDLHRVRGEAEERAGLGVVEGLDAERIDGAEEAAPAGIPDREGEVAKEMIGAGLAPFEIGREEELRIRGFRASGGREPGDEIRPVVQPAVQQDADLPLRIEERSIRLAKGEMGQPRASQEAAGDPAGSTVGGELRQAPKTFRLDPGSREIHHAEEATHPSTLRRPRAARVSTNRPRSSRRRSSGTSYSVRRARQTASISP
jgi:hypothetical protein